MLVLIYDLAADYIDRRGPLREEHLALARAAHDRGELQYAGALSDPHDRALFVWRTEDEAIVRQFAESDPYVLNGLVISWAVRTWNVAVGATD